MKLQIGLAVLLISACCCSSAPAQQADRVLSRQQVAAIDSNPTSLPVTQTARFPDLRLSDHPDQATVNDGQPAATPKISGSLVTICSSLAVVLGLFAGLVWVNRKLGGGGGNHGAIPKEVVQSLGSTPIDSRNRITMIRCGNRILVLAQNAQGVQPISEITSPDEVRDLTAACLGNAKQAFASTLQSIEKEPTKAGFLDGQPKQPTPRSRGRLFASA